MAFERYGLAFSIRLAICSALLVVAATESTDAQAFGRACDTHTKFALAIQGGAVWGTIHHPQQEAFVRKQLQAGRNMLSSGETAVDVVEVVIAAMENSGIFNAGRGSVANQNGEVELDASIMEGRHLSAGAVAGVKHMKNPITAARWVMEKTPNVLMIGKNADDLLARSGQATVPSSYFRFSRHNYSELKFPADVRPESAGAAVPASLRPLAGVWAGVMDGRLTTALVVEHLRRNDADVAVALGSNEELGFSKPTTARARAKLQNGFLIVQQPSFRLTYRLEDDETVEATLRLDNGERISGRLRRAPELLGSGGTVGAVVLDRCGDLAAGTSTGGYGSKMPGRVGDSPIIGAGTFADNRSVAISATGHGESFIRHVAAHQIAARVRFGGETLHRAVQKVLFNELEPDSGGVIAIDHRGTIVMLSNTAGMIRGSTTDETPPVVQTYAVP